MSKPQLLDVVRLTAPVPDLGLAAGEVGTIVMEFDTPREAYEVEFSDDEGETVAMCSLTPDQFEVIWSAEAERDRVGAAEASTT